MSQLRYSEKSFYKAIRYNIERYQHMARISDKQLAAALGLSADALEKRLLGIEPFTAWEIDQCAQCFNCSFDMLYPDTRILKIDVLWTIARDLPSTQFERLFKQAVALGREAAQNSHLP